MWGSFLTAAEGLLSVCDVWWAPLELRWRATLEVQGCVLSGWSVGGSMGKVLSTFGTSGSSLKFVVLLLSSSEGLHSTYCRELVSICSRKASV